MCIKNLHLKSTSNKDFPIRNKWQGKLKNGCRFQKPLKLENDRPSVRHRKVYHRDARG
jgi:hypothetical protein